MEELEKKLQSYRNIRKREHLLRCLKSYLWEPISSLFSFEMNVETDTPDKVSVTSQTTNETLDLKSNKTYVSHDAQKPSSWIKLIFNLVIWCLLFTYAVYIQFGAVFIILSGFFLIWSNTRTEPRHENEISAYSVFNPNCEPIDGTLDAEQFEKEIRYGLVF